MTRAALSVCNEPGCSELTREPRCPAHTKTRNAEIRSHVDYAWVYRSPRWRALRRLVREEQPFCLCGCNEPWVDLDHVIPLGTLPDMDPFDRTNTEGRCKASHSRKTAREVWHAA